MRLMICVLAVLLLSPVAQCATLDAIEADVCSKWNNFQSMTYDMEATTNIAQQGFSMKSNTTGTAEMKRKSETVWLMRMDSKASSTQTVAGNETKSDSITQMVVDGEYAYTYTEAAGTKMAMKTKSQDWTKMMGGKSFFQWLKENHDVKVLADESVDGVSCYAIEATPKDKQQSQFPMKFCFSKDNGMTILTEVKGADGKVMTSSKIKNIKTNPSLADDRFVFKAPAGVTVTDMTNPNAAAAQPQAQPQPAPAKDEPAPKETAEKKDTEKKDTEKKDTGDKKDEPDKKKKRPKLGF